MIAEGVAVRARVEKFGEARSAGGQVGGIAARLGKFSRGSTRLSRRGPKSFQAAKLR